jgi:DNA-binding transcriptional regulator YiaG
MPVSKESKTIKRQTISRAVKALRNRLGWAQPKLARAVGEDLDRGTLSRWERGQEAPQSANAEALAVLAEKHGWNDLVGAFRDPVSNWKEVVFTGDERHLLVLFEMVLINREHEPGDGGLIREKQFVEVVRALMGAVKTLKRAHAEGERIEIVGEEQTAAWLTEITPKRKLDEPPKRTRKKTATKRTTRTKR